MTNPQVYSDFWLNNEKISEYLDLKSPNQSDFFLDLIQLASVRRIISNYVGILTGKDIPVFFKSEGDSYNVNGKAIYITAEIRKKKDFDNAVGLALHEGAHTVLTDFDLLVTIPFNTPSSIWSFCRKHKIHLRTMERFLKIIFNIIEDWYIDDWVISRVPGYMGYYESSYDVCFNNPKINELLLSREFRYPSLRSYEFRIINFTNPLTDLSALPGLEEIAKTINISSISRLKTTKERILLTYEVVVVVLKYLEEFHASDKNSGKNGNKRIDINAFFKTNNSEDETSSSKAPEKQKSSSQSDCEKKSKSELNDTDDTIQDIANVIGNKPRVDEENKKIIEQTNQSIEKTLSSDLKEAIKNQFDYINGYCEKQDLNSSKKVVLDLVEKHGISLVYVPFVYDGKKNPLKVGCIVVKKLTMDLILSGNSIFPMSSFWKDMDGNIKAHSENEKSVYQGIILGSKLGRRLLLRREIHSEKNIRRKEGKINRRLLFSAGFESVDIFEKINIHQYSKCSLHITVDSSSSMSGEKWNKTMTMCVAIAKATSMVDNVHVTISFRTTHTSNGKHMPYVILAYDSKLDKFSKIKNLFPFLSPSGGTPEGLAFDATMSVFTKTSPDEKNKYFLNISDGEPYFNITSAEDNLVIHYGDELGVEHTRSQINKIRKSGVEILSYYINTNSSKDVNHDTKKNFKLMYGKDSKFITPNSVPDLARTMNELFIKKSLK